MNLWKGLTSFSNSPWQFWFPLVTQVICLKKWTVNSPVIVNLLLSSTILLTLSLIDPWCLQNLTQIPLATVKHACYRNHSVHIIVLHATSVY